MRTGIFVTACVLAVMVAAAFAGSLDAPADPTSATSAMFTLEDVYQRLATGAAGTKRVGPFAEPGAGPAPTGHTLDQVMGLAPSVDNTNSAGVADVASGKTFWGLNTGTWGLRAGIGVTLSTPAPVPKTGQTGCWDASGTSVGCTGTGQDGEKLKGVPSPSPRFTDNSNGTVTDNLTGLIWLKDANCWGTLNWTTALTNANGLKGDNTMCGLNDGSTAGQWRLPNLRELQSLIDYQNVNPALPTGHPFGSSVQPYYYWSATTHAGGMTNAWHVHLGDGSMYYNVKPFAGDVWPVR